jgi:hypothetical protein
VQLLHGIKIKGNQSATSLEAVIIKAFDQNKIIALGSKKDDQIIATGSGTTATLPGTHAYAITKVEQVGGKWMFTIRNPWGKKLDTFGDEFTRDIDFIVKYFLVAVIEN